MNENRVLESVPQNMTPVPEEYLDGCTMFWDNLIDHDISHCCLAHDEAYWYSETLVEKYQADLDLAMCVVEEGGDVLSIVAAMCILLGVGTVGTFFWLRKDKWLKKNSDED